MPSYKIPLVTAFLVFALIAFLGTVPWTIYQYRKHGYFSFWRNVVIFSFIYYGLTAFFLVSLPLPQNRNNDVVFKDHVYTQLKSLNMLSNFQQVPGFIPTQIRTYPILFKSFTFLEVFFNIALLFPLGVYLRYFLKKAKKWYVALGFVFATTLFFEVSQLTALFGYYAHPYRLFDVDDLLTNTIGGMLGFLMAPLLLKLIPSRDELKEKDDLYGPSSIASYGAQLIEVFVSLGLSRMVGSLVSVIFFSGNYLFICNLVSIFVFIVLYPLILKGKTLGGQLVKIQFSMDAVSNGLQLSYRYLLLVIPSIFSQITLQLNQLPSENVYVISSQIIFFLATFIVWTAFWIIILRDWVKKRPEPFFNRLVHLTMIRYKKEADPK